MRLVFLEIYYEFRFFYYFLSFIGFEIHYLKILYLSDVSDNNFYIKQIQKLKKKKIYLINILDYEKDGFYFEDFDNDFTGDTLILNKYLLTDKVLKIISKYFNTNVTKKKFELYMRAILQSNIQKQFQQDGSKINYWINNNSSTKRNIIFFSNFANYFLKLDNKKIIKIYFPIHIIYIPVNLIFKIIKKTKKIIILFIKKLNKVNQIKIKKNKININFNSKYLYVFHKSQMYGKLFKKKLFFFDNDKHLSANEMSAVMYHENNENIFNLLAISKKKKIKCLLKTIFLFVVLVTREISLKNIAVAILYSKIYFRFEIFRLNLLLFKNLKAVFIDWDTNCPKELILLFESKNVKTICVQERSIQSCYKYFYNVICDNFLSSVPQMKEIFLNKPYSSVNNIIEYGSYREDYFFDKKYDKIITKKYRINKDQKTIVIFAHHAETSIFNQANNLITNWDNHYYFLNETFEILSKLENIRVIYRFKNLDWIEIDKFQNIINKIKSNENMFIDNEYEKSFFSYYLARFADIAIGPHSSLLDELIQSGFKNVLIMDYGYKLKSIIKKLKYEGSDFLCENRNIFMHKLNVLLNDNKNLNFKNNKIRQKYLYKDKLYEILKDELKI